jgi:drug/metabolite transporter (DMT)-like permease
VNARVSLPAPEAGNRSVRGMTASALATLGWGFAGVFANLAHAPGLVLTFYRTWLGAAVLIAAMAVLGRRMSWRLVWAATPGGLLLCGDMTMFFSAVKLTSVAVATVIGALQPVLVLLAAGPLIGERVDRRMVAWTALAIVGVVVIVLGAGVPTGGERLGDFLAVGSLVCWAGYFVASKRAVPGNDALGYTTAVTVVAAVGATVVLFCSPQSPGHIHATDWIWIALLGLVPATSHVLLNWAHRHLDVAVQSVIASANPIVAGLAAWVILGQRLNALQIAGGIVGVGAISVVAVRRREVAV